MKAKHITFILLLLATGMQIFAQVQITGKVLEANNTPIVGATISLRSKEVLKGTLTNEKGEFEITAQPGEYRLEIRFLGYETYHQTHTFNHDQSYNLGTITLKASAQELQTIEVVGRARLDYNSDYSFSATKIGIDNKELSQSLTAVTKELIVDRQAFQLADAVKAVSGVAPSSYYNQYNIRGISQNEEGQFINGMRTRQYYFLQPITSNIERVEVLKGPASVTFSSVDPGGSINMVTKKPLREKRREIHLSTGSYSTIRGSLDFTGPLNESNTLLYRLNAAVQEAKSFRDIVHNNAMLVSPSISYIPDDKTAFNVEMIYSYLNGNLDRGQPIFGAVAGETDLNSTPISMNLGASNDYFKSKEFIIMANLTRQLTDHISLNASYMKQTWEEDLQEHRTTNAFAVDMDNNPISTLAAMRFVQRQQFWNTDNLSAYLIFDFNLGQTKHKLLAGYDLSKWRKYKGGGQNSARGYLLNDGSVTNSYDPDNAESYQTIVIDSVTMPKPNVDHFDLTDPSNAYKNIQDYTMNSIIEIPSALTQTHAAYIQEQLKIGRFSALLGLRQEWYKDYTYYDTPDEISYTNSALIPRVGLTYGITRNINVYATYLEGYQPQSNTVTLMPSTSQFFWGESPARFKPLISDLKEVGAKGEFFDKKVFVTISVYEINQKNILISANDAENPDSLVQRGADRSRGFEWELSGYIMSNLQLNASYSYIDAKIIEDDDESLEGSRKENTPKNSANLWARYDFSNNSPFNGLGVGFGVQYSSDKVPWFTRDFIVPAYTICDMAVYYRPLKSKVQLMLKINNLFDKTYWVGAQNYLRLFPGAPRNMMFTSIYKF